MVGKSRTVPAARSRKVGKRAAPTKRRAKAARPTEVELLLGRRISALRAGLVAAVEEMTDGARRDGEIRADLDPAVVRTLIEHTAHAVARVHPPSQDLADAYLTVLLDGLRPAP